MWLSTLNHWVRVLKYASLAYLSSFVFFVKHLIVFHIYLPETSFKNGQSFPVRMERLRIAHYLPTYLSFCFIFDF